MEDMATTPHLPDSSIPLDDVPESPEEKALVDERRAQVERGEVRLVPHAEVMQKIAERKARESR
jgi:hypothetical protein